MGKLNGVLILECIDKVDPGSEGHFLSHMFKIMNVPSQHVEIRTKRQFIAMLGANPFDAVHIATHGRVGETFDGFWTHDKTVRLDDFPETCLHGKMVVSTACRSGSKQFGNALMTHTSSKYYVAPLKSPQFRNAIYFAHWFYHNIFVLKLSPKQAMKKYRMGYKNPHDFRLFQS